MYDDRCAMVDNVKRINLWSGPRNVSTALMYSFAQRADTRVIDEPLYAHYLRVSGAAHPDAQAVIASMDSDGNRVVRDVILGPTDRPVLFLKQMTHHLVDLDESFLFKTTNVLLIRDPLEMLPSLAQVIGKPILRDTGFAKQSDLHRRLAAAGTPPPVVDARQLLLNPRHVLSTLCQQLDIPFMETMLSWPPGPRPEDGVWAKHWYRNVHRSTGFLPYAPREGEFPEQLRPLLEECRPHYEYLSAHAIQSPI
jgi:hypothetical protein